MDFEFFILDVIDQCYFGVVFFLFYCLLMIKVLQSVCKVIIQLIVIIYYNIYIVQMYFGVIYIFSYFYKFYVNVRVVNSDLVKLDLLFNFKVFDRICDF